MECIKLFLKTKDITLNLQINIPLHLSILRKFSELEGLFTGSFQLFLVTRDDVPELQEFELEPPFPLLDGNRLFDLNIVR